MIFILLINEGFLIKLMIRLQECKSPLEMLQDSSASGVLLGDGLQMPRTRKGERERERENQSLPTIGPRQVRHWTRGPAPLSTLGKISSVAYLYVSARKSRGIMVPYSKYGLMDTANIHMPGVFN